MGDQKFAYPETLWAGTDHSLQLAMDVHGMIMAGMFGQQAQPEDEEKPHNYTLQGNVGIVSIKGPLVNRDHWYNRYAGVTSYSDVGRALVYAATQADAKAILLDIDSGGGAVAGLADTGNLIATIGKIKPMYTFSGGAMASAAYWLGSSAGKGRVFVSPTTISGSLGVIATHMEYSKALKESGVGVNVVRSGKYKALLNSVEPASEKAIEQLQAQLDAAYQIFAEHVIDMRGATMEQFEAVMGQGREFFGAQAVKANLADGVKSFDAVMSMIVSKIDRTENREHNASNFQRGNPMTRQALTEQELAALKAGGGQTDVSAEAEAAAAEAAATAAAASAAAAAAAAPATKPAPSADVLALLNGQVAEGHAKVTQLTVELAGVKERLTGFEASHPALMKLVAQSVSTMKVALGLTAIDLSAMSPAALLAEHAAAEAQFNAKFKGGRVSSAATTEASKQDTALDDQDYLARVGATRLK